MPDNDPCLTIPELDISINITKDKELYFVLGVEKPNSIILLNAEVSLKLAKFLK